MENHTAQSQSADESTRERKDNKNEGESSVATVDSDTNTGLDRRIAQVEQIVRHIELSGISSTQNHRGRSRSRSRATSYRRCSPVHEESSHEDFASAGPYYRREDSPSESLYFDTDESWPLQTAKEAKSVPDRLIYTYTKILHNEVRLLRISPGQWDDPVHCALKRSSIETLQKSERSGLHFQALSYAWGTDRPENAIFLQDISMPRADLPVEEILELFAQQSKPRSFLVRDNLYNALRRIRRKDDDSWVWIDALCINQEDVEEKAHQLRWLPIIYSKAWNVAVWLGEADSSADLAVALITQILNLRMLDSMLSSVPPDDILSAWAAFAALLQRPWFCRRWVIQEVACASRLSIRIGDKILSWGDFADAVELFFEKLDWIRLIYSQSKLAQYDPDAFNGVDSSGALALLVFSRTILRKTTDARMLARVVDLESLVLASANFAVSEVRDVIYALLYLAHDAISGDLKIEADYSRSLLDIYSDFVGYCFNRRTSLDIICRTRAYWPNGCNEFMEAVGLPPEPPSWIGLVQDSTYGPPSRFTGRINGESLVGTASNRVYNASWGAKMQAHLMPLFPSDPLKADGKTKERFSGILSAKGIKLGRLIEVSSRVIEGTIADDCLKILGWEGNIEHGVTEQLWRTLVANRGPGGRAAPTWYRRACALALTRASLEGDLNTTKLLADKRQPSTVMTFLKRVQSVVWSRKFFRCLYEQQIVRSADGNKQSGIAPHELNMVGFGSRKIAEGDIVCILFGCSVPVILREVKNQQAGTFRLVGECYVHGNTEGEMFAAKALEDIDASSTEFRIR